MGIYGNCEVMWSWIWLDIPSKYIGDSCVIVIVPVGIFSERLTDTSSQDFFPWSLAFF